jgi:hypothetical protein
MWSSALARGVHDGSPSREEQRDGVADARVHPCDHHEEAHRVGAVYVRGCEAKEGLREEKGQHRTGHQVDEHARDALARLVHAERRLVRKKVALLRVVGVRTRLEKNEVWRLVAE